MLGHNTELISEDAECSASGGEAAARAIVADPTIAAVVGTSCSVSALPAAPIIPDAGYSMVSPSNTAPELTDRDTHAAGYLRVVWNERDQGVAMAEFVRGEGAATSAVVVQSGPPPLSVDDAGVAFVETLRVTRRRQPGF
jgi:branched-chain amino acid transport system substrate-binding protein